MSAATKENDAAADVVKSTFEDEYLRQYLVRVAENLGILDPKFTINSKSNKGDNYVGVVYRIHIEGENNGTWVKFPAIFKVPPTDEIARQVLQVSHLFPREHVFYTEIVPVFREFLRTKNMSLEKIAECYFSTADNHKEAICLEDLQAKGFVMRDRIEEMNFAHASMAFRALGRLHALSFALRDQRPEVFAEKITTLKEPLFREDLVGNSYFVARLEVLRKLVKIALAAEESRYMEKFLEYEKDSVSYLEWSCAGKSAEPYAVLNHGDFWTNNMLFKYKEGSDEPDDIYLLDFQIARYASPALDISYLIFCNCRKELRDTHFDDLLKIYHESLSVYLSQLGSDPKTLFPYDVLLSHMKKFGIFIGTMSTLVLHLFTSQGDDIHNFAHTNDDLTVLEERLRRDDLWRNSLRDVFKDLIDKNYI